MRESKFIKANEKIAEGVVGSYKKIETGVVGEFTKISDKFVDQFLTHEGETTAEAKNRLHEEQILRENKQKEKQNIK